MKDDDFKICREAMKKLGRDYVNRRLRQMINGVYSPVKVYNSKKPNERVFGTVNGDVIELWIKAQGVSWEGVFNLITKKHKVIRIKQCLMWYFHDHLNWTDEQISGQFGGHSKSNVCTARNKFVTKCTSHLDDDYIDIYESFRDFALKRQFTWDSTKEFTIQRFSIRR